MIGVNDQYYDDNNVPKMTLVPEKEINTNNADYDAQPQFLYPEHKDGLRYQELGHGDGYVEPVKAIDAEKDAASSLFMNNYNDNQVYQPNFDEALAREITSTTTEDIKETVIKAEELKTAEVQNSIKVLSNRAEIERQNILKANKVLGLSDDNAPYVQDKEKGTYETDNMTVYRPREIEFEKEAEIKAAETKRKIQAEKDQAIADKLTAQDQFMSTLPGRDDIAGNNSYFVDSGQKLIQGDIKESMIDQEKGFADVIAGTTAKDMTTTVREIEVERAKKDADRRIQQAIDDEQSTNAKKIEEQRIDEARTGSRVT